MQLGYVWAKPKMPREFGALTLSMSMKWACWHGLFEWLKRVVASQLFLSCYKTPVPYLYSLRAALSPSSPSFSIHHWTVLVSKPSLSLPSYFPNPSWPRLMLPDTSQPQAQLLALKLLCPSSAFSARCGGSCCHAKPHCCRHLLVPFSSVPLMSLQQQLCISFWQGFKNTAKRHL